MLSIALSARHTKSTAVIACSGSKISIKWCLIIFLSLIEGLVVPISKCLYRLRESTFIISPENS